ncbi:hypothetical protein ACRYI5_00665 [Furfurilactobacillus sp. WILCCON 0119]
MDKFFGLLFAALFAYAAYRLYQRKTMTKWLRISLLILTSIFAIASLIGPFSSSEQTTAPRSTTSTGSLSPRQHKKATKTITSSHVDDSSSSTRNSMSQSIAESTSASQSLEESASRQSVDAAKQSSSAQSAANAAAASSQKAVAEQSSTVATTEGGIIGDSKSHIYHMPDQVSYHISPANAVTFSSESEAQAAGYRKSLR